MTAELLAIYVEGTADLNDEQIKQGIGLAVRELTFFPKVAELRALAGQGSKQLAEGEAHKAWEIVTDFADTWVQSDVHGRYVIDPGCRSTQPPALSGKILACVRRCGGWRAFKTMSAGDLPFQRERFLEEYKNCEITESIPLDRLLTAATFTRALPHSEPRQPKATAEKSVPGQYPRQVPEPMSDAQLCDRREILRQQAELLKARTPLSERRQTL